MKNKIAELAINQTWVNIKSRAIVETAIATAVVVIVPAIFAHTPQNQFIVGPIVNAVLFWVALRVGVANALFIAVVPSLIALFRGLLPPTAAMVVPFIIAGNCAMILVFAFLKTLLWRVGSGYILFLPVILASITKTLVIFLPAFALLSLSPQVSFMMSWPQLATALIGGFAAVKLSKSLKFKV